MESAYEFTCGVSGIVIIILDFFPLPLNDHLKLVFLLTI